MYEEGMRENVKQMRHREFLAFLIVIMGMISLMGGLTMTILLSNHMSWFLFFPYEPSSSGMLGMTLTLLGFTLISVGFVSAVYYDREKSWFSRQIRESDATAETILEKEGHIKNE